MPATSLLRPNGRKRLGLSQLYAWHLKPLVWRLFHPGGTPEEYYARSIAGRVVRGAHPAIGSQARSVRAPTELLDILLTHGLKPQHVVVDYGCGSFRLGKALIQYLEPGHYWGLDVIDEFLESGMALLEPELKAEKFVGLLLSVALMGIAAGFIASLLKRWPWIAYFGLCIILWVSLSMIYRGTHEVMDEMDDGAALPIAAPAVG